MANKSYKQLYEETKAMLDENKAELEKCKAEIEKLREQRSLLTEEELQALKIVATGCNTNTRLSGQREYVDSLVMVFKLIERLSV